MHRAPALHKAPPPSQLLANFPTKCFFNVVWGDDFLKDGWGKKIKCQTNTSRSPLLFLASTSLWKYGSRAGGSGSGRSVCACTWGKGGEGGGRGVVRGDSPRARFASSRTTSTSPAPRRTPRRPSHPATHRDGTLASWRCCFFLSPPLSQILLSLRPLLMTRLSHGTPAGWPIRSHDDDARPRPPPHAPRSSPAAGHTRGVAVARNDKVIFARRNAMIFACLVNSLLALIIELIMIF